MAKREALPQITAPEAKFAARRNYCRRFALASVSSTGRFGKAAAEPPHSKMFCATETLLAGS
jgi:hypothetical protein